jgi:hypothetical protein
LLEEELAYVSARDPFHQPLQAARQALGLDIVGFDYSIDREGQIVVWEANPFLNLNFPPRGRADHLFASIHRTFAIVARLYSIRAGIPVPPAVEDLIDESISGWSARRAA